MGISLAANSGVSCAVLRSSHILISQTMMQQHDTSPTSRPLLTPVTNWIALSGVSCSGKTSTGLELVRLGYERIPETMRVWMDGLKSQGAEISELKKADPLSFRRDLFEVAHGIGESLVPRYANERMFFTRPGIDALAFMKADGLPYELERERMSRSFRFSLVCVFDPLPFVPDGTRVNNPEYRIRLHEALLQVCDELGYSGTSLLRVPAYSPDGATLTIEDRAKLIVDGLPKMANVEAP
ncbi:MAG: ATP-binding protein [Deltaproteobacteria bacterium]|nr:ATP-binding protein [Deltaproteobacteria bacterium]